MAADARGEGPVARRPLALEHRLATAASGRPRQPPAGMHPNGAAQRHRGTVPLPRTLPAAPSARQGHTGGAGGHWSTAANSSNSVRPAPNYQPAAVAAATVAGPPAAIAPLISPLQHARPPGTAVPAPAVAMTNRGPNPHQPQQQNVAHPADHRREQHPYIIPADQQVACKPPLNHIRHAFYIQKKGDLGFSICEDLRNPKLTRVCNLRPQSCAWWYGLMDGDMLVPPKTQAVPPVAAASGPIPGGVSHDATRAWFLKRCTWLPLDFHVFRKYDGGGDGYVDRIVRILCHSPDVLKGINYSIHRIVVHEDEDGVGAGGTSPTSSLGFDVSERTYGSCRLAIVTAVRTGSVAHKRGIRPRDLICRLTNRGRMLENVYSWIESKMEQRRTRTLRGPILLEVVRLHRVREGETSLLRMWVKQRDEENAKRGMTQRPPPQPLQQQQQHVQRRDQGGQLNAQHNTNPSGQSSVGDRMTFAPIQQSTVNSANAAQQEHSHPSRQHPPHARMHFKSNINPCQEQPPNGGMPRGMAPLANNDRNPPPSPPKHHSQERMKEGPPTTRVQNDLVVDLTEEDEDLAAVQRQLSKKLEERKRPTAAELAKRPPNPETMNGVPRPEPLHASTQHSSKPVTSSRGEELAASTNSTTVAPLDDHGSAGHGGSKSTEQQPEAATATENIYEDQNTTKSSAGQQHLLSKPTSEQQLLQTLAPGDDGDVRVQGTKEQRPKTVGTSNLQSNNPLTALPNDDIQSKKDTAEHQLSELAKQDFQGTVAALDDDSDSEMAVQKSNQQSDNPQTAVRKDNNFESEPTTEQYHRPVAYKIGTKVTKVFHDEELGKRRPFAGKVKAFDAEEMLYKIIYEDGDAEELSESELDKIVVDKKKKHKKKRKNALLLTGTLSYSEQDGKRRHVIQGEWTGNNSSPQSFELVRDLSREEDLKVLPLSGIFNGSFVYVCHVGAFKLKMSDIVKENDVNLSFYEDQKGCGQKSFSVKGGGMNRFGAFEISGTATKKTNDPLSYSLRLKKKYTAAPPEPQGGSPHTSDGVRGDDKPPPSKLYSTGVLCLRGQLTRSRTSDDNIIVQKINGLWAASLETIIECDRKGTIGGLCKPFEYTLRSNNIGSPESSKPLSGKFSGWFIMDDNKIQEQDVSMKFRDNSEGYYNIEGMGVNEFGQYKISGTMTSERVVTIFRHYLPPPSV